MKNHHLRMAQKHKKARWNRALLQAIKVSRDGHLVPIYNPATDVYWDESRNQLIARRSIAKDEIFSMSAADLQRAIVGGKRGS